MGFWQVLCRDTVHVTGGGVLQGFSQTETISPPDPPVSADVEELWIGLNDLKLQMNFEWSDGTPVRFTYWHPFEPNNFRDSLEDCVTIWGPVRAQGLILHLCREHCSILMAGEGITQGASPARVEPGLFWLLGWEGSSTASLGI